MIYLIKSYDRQKSAEKSAFIRVITANYWHCKD